MTSVLSRLHGLQLWQVSVLLLLMNVALRQIALVGGEWVARRYRSRRIIARPTELRFEDRLGVVTLVLNSAVSVAGWLLWRRGDIEFSPALGPAVVRDAVLLTIAMDAAMYAGHRVAHHHVLYPLVHVLHHRFVLPRPATLFAMHPIEVFGFGAMWLTALVVFTAVGFPLTAAGIGIYVAVNLLFGTMGHVGVEPLPDRLRRSWLFRWVATPSFHVGHHLDPRSNMGFYSTVWDRMFGTLAADYDVARAQPPVLHG